ncbi:phenazine biosynthesis FMN-dependent oxidase PhzG [Actinopolyspora mortivallis]|uniref:phenazine biosynthesis FMN-dependent oxidase PhzG n=1 Tax=Actinopolyspora mortivallis TaxID=33906 RepID=UPI0006859C6D|nr:phenazine biosynthesis FMN-dependent oxidase PhzG [Actinopolyspora mortivallis]
MSERSGTAAAEAVERSSEFESLTGHTELGFPEYDTPPEEPLGLVRHWLDTATRLGVREPRSLALATADEHGRPSNRIVTVGELSERGLVFTTHTTSRKSRDIAENPRACGLFYWRETAQQISLAGSVRRLDEAECDALWAERPVALHPMSAASRQSEPLENATALRAEARRLAEPGTSLPRPPRFTGFLLVPEEVEFWCARPDRLHRRLRYTREGTVWEHERLQP